MQNQEILTALRNALDRNETLETAKQILINSGYNPREVEEASHFVSSGILTNQVTKPDEELIMPDKKQGFFAKLFKRKKKKPKHKPNNNQMKDIKQAIYSEQDYQDFEQDMPLPDSEQIKSLPKQKIKRKSHLKEIILLIILLVLIGVLIISFVFRETIIGWFGA